MSFRAFSIVKKNKLSIFRKFKPFCVYRQASQFSKMTIGESALSPDEFRPFELVHIDPRTHNTKQFRFKLNEGQVLGLPVASCIVVRAEIEGETVIRPYTPVSKGDVEGFFELLIKVYPTGTMSKHLFNMQVGDTLDVKGPFLKKAYPFGKKAIAMLAGGTGITPMFQVIQEFLAHPEDRTELTLVFGNLTPNDIMLHDVLVELAKKHDNLNVHLIVDKATTDDNWTGLTGYMTGSVLKDILPPPSDDIWVFVCGPPPMMNAISGNKMPDKSQGELSGALKELGYSESNVFKF
eukprot:213638_1